MPGRPPAAAPAAGPPAAGAARNSCSNGVSHWFEEVGAEAERGAGSSALRHEAESDMVEVDDRKVRRALLE